jgi:hypothetical protein
MARAVRSRLMMFMTVAVLTLCGGGASTQDEVQPTNDLVVSQFEFLKPSKKNLAVL